MKGMSPFFRMLLFILTSLSTYALENDTGFLANWMGYIMPVVGDLTLLDISLPGTHDR